MYIYYETLVATDVLYAYPEQRAGRIEAPLELPSKRLKRTTRPDAMPPRRPPNDADAKDDAKNAKKKSPHRWWL